MRVLVIGAAGKTGRLAVERALTAGHAVTAFVHDANEFQGNEAKVVQGDVKDAEAIAKAVAGQDAVIDTLGGHTPYKDTDLERRAANNILAAMKSNGVRRLVVVSMLGIGDSKAQTGFFYGSLMMPTFLRGATKDKEAMETEVKASDVDFVLVRPPFLSDDEPLGSVAVVEGEASTKKITRADLAEFLVEQLTSDQYLHQAVTVVNP